MAITTTTWEYDDDDGEMSALMMVVLRGGPPHYKKHVSTGPKGRPASAQASPGLGGEEINLRKRGGGELSTHFSLPRLAHGNNPSHLGRALHCSPWSSLTFNGSPVNISEEGKRSSASGTSKGRGNKEGMMGVRRQYG
jgi:hypothetical protein